MTDDTRDADLETHIQEFLRALNQRPAELIQKHIAQIEKPDPQDMEDLRRYVTDLKRNYGQGLTAMYGRIASHGRAICELTDETEITGPVEKMMALVAADADDVPKVLLSFDAAANELNLRTILGLFQTLRDAGARGLPRQGQLDELMVDFTTYCLMRFPPSDDD
ncbi:MAG TPA: hypothetical protein VLZ05_08095 [Mycobacterium sp.]|nr:hypothetical protein [Mycobacterium sp.]HUH68841.1 hypothetical protein [Mycobacterium sp.]